MIEILRVITWLLVLGQGFLVSSCWTAESKIAISQESYPYRFLISDMVSQKILIIETNGAASWEHPQPGWVMDGERLTNGNILYCWMSEGKEKQAGVREITLDKRVVFEYAIAQECHSVQRLPDGLTLIEDPANKRLIEVDRDGKIVHELKLQVWHDQVHRVARQCRKLSNGNYLAAQTFDQAVIEYAPDGQVLRRFPASGMVYGVSRLPNGHTLIGTGGGKEAGQEIGKRALEVDAQGKTVWSFEPSDFPSDSNLEWVLSAQRLPGGNTVIVNFLGHGKNGRGISLLEVTPAKKVMWAFHQQRIILLMQILP